MRKILNFREQFLNPKGLTISPTSYFKKPAPVNSLFDLSVTLHRASKPLDKNQVVFKLQPYKYPLNKLELKQYFTKLYGLNVEKVNTVNYIGAIKRAPKGGRFRERDFKKVYVTLNEDIEPFFQKIEK